MAPLFRGKIRPHLARPETARTSLDHRLRLLVGRSGADYRLELISTSGATRFSSIVHLEGRIDNRIVVFPVPAREMLQLSSSESIYHIVCIGIDGINYHLPFQKYGRNLYQADISRLRRGIYFVKVNDTQIKFVKQ